MKNVPVSEKFVLSKLVDFVDGQVVSRTLSQTEAATITVFAFAEGEGLSTHSSGGDAFVIVLEGKGRFTIDGVDHVLSAGESIVMPCGHPHAVQADERFKMLLVVAFPLDGSKGPLTIT